MQAINNRINVYRLISPDDIVAQQDAIARAFFGMRSANDGDRKLIISPISGRLSYTDAGRLWKAPGDGGLPRDAREAQQVAEEFLRDARSRFNAAQARAQIDLSQLIPTQLIHIKSVVARAPGQSFADHWLSIFGVVLPTGIPGQGSAFVDAKIELRMGGNRQPVAMYSTWRPFDARLLVRHIAFSGSLESPQLFYRMADSEDPQTFIAPFYRTANDDTGTLWPASSYSLIADITAQDTGSGILLSAVTPDGLSGPFDYAWGAWRIDNPAVGFRMLGTGRSQINLTGVGSYNVVLDVQDQRTGAFTRTQRVVFVSQQQEQLVT